MKIVNNKFFISCYSDLNSNAIWTYYKNIQECWVWSETNIDKLDPVVVFKVKNK